MDAWECVYRHSESDLSLVRTSGSARPSSELDSSEAELAYERTTSRLARTTRSGAVGGDPSITLQATSDFGHLTDDEYDSKSPPSASTHHNHRIPPHQQRVQGHPQTKREPSGYFVMSPRGGTRPLTVSTGTATTDFTSAHGHDGITPPVAGANISFGLPTETISAVPATVRQRDRRRAKAHVQSPLALIERHRATTALGLTYGEMKLLALAGAGFMMDAYDLFIINLIYPILLRTYYPPGTTQLDWGLSGGVLRASANIGNVVGQLLFGFFGDFWGRSLLYGKELILVIAAVALMIAAPEPLGPFGVTVWICAFRVLMGIGIGGDYPLSACIVADRASLKSRGRLLAIIFSNQGWGTLFGAVMSIIVLAAYRPTVEAGHLHALNGAWRILQGVVLVPALIVLYFRLTLVESTRFVQARYLQDHPDYISKASAAGMELTRAKARDDRGAEEIAMGNIGVNDTTGISVSVSQPFEHAISPPISPISGFDRVESHTDHPKHHFPSQQQPQRKIPPTAEVKDAMRSAMLTAKGLNFSSVGVPRNDFWRYFRQWRHARRLLGACLCWFLIDISFYGINLNQASLLSIIGFTEGDVWTKLMKTATGNLIVVLAGYLPGYFITILTIEWLGRKKIQMFGFAVNAVLFLVLALRYPQLQNDAPAFFTVFVLLNLSFNFGANATTFIIPAEIFPSRVRATAHGVAAASGKIGAIISSLGFSALASPTSIGATGVFWIYLGVSVAGLIVTVFLVDETKGFDPDAEDRQEMLEQSERA